MKILAIDTCAGLCAVCVFDSTSERVLSQISEDIGRGHAERLMGMIVSALKSCEVTYRELGRIAVTCGPGSFTGVRVGLATARGLALGLEIPAVAINTLEGLEYAARVTYPCGPLATVIDARRSEAYFQTSGFEDRHKNTGPAIATHEEIPKWLEDDDDDTWALCGSGAQIINRHLSKPGPVIHQLGAVPIEMVARLGAGRIKHQPNLEPVYLRQPNAKPQTGFTLPRLSPAGHGDD